MSTETLKRPLPSSEEDFIPLDSTTPLDIDKDVQEDPSTETSTPKSTQNKAKQSKRKVRRLTTEDLVGKITDLQAAMISVTSKFVDGQELKNMSAVLIAWENWASQVLPLPFDEFLLQAEREASRYPFKVSFKSKDHPPQYSIILPKKALQRLADVTTAENPPQATGVEELQQDETVSRASAPIDVSDTTEEQLRGGEEEEELIIEKKETHSCSILVSARAFVNQKGPGCLFNQFSAVDRVTIERHDEDMEGYYFGRGSFKREERSEEERESEDERQQPPFQFYDNSEPFYPPQYRFGSVMHQPIHNQDYQYTHDPYSYQPVHPVPFEYGTPAPMQPSFYLQDLAGGSNSAYRPPIPLSMPQILPTVHPLIPSFNQYTMPMHREMYPHSNYSSECTTTSYNPSLVRTETTVRTTVHATKKPKTEVEDHPGVTRFRLARQPAPEQRRCYLKENRYIKPNPIVIKEVVHSTQPKILTAKVTVRLADEDGREIPHDDPMHIIAKDSVEQTLERKRLPTGDFDDYLPEAKYQLKVICPGVKETRFRLIFFVEYSTEYGSNGEEKICSDVIQLKGNKSISGIPPILNDIIPKVGLPHTKNEVWIKGRDIRRKPGEVRVLFDGIEGEVTSATENLVCVIAPIRPDLIKDEKRVQVSVYNLYPKIAAPSSSVLYYTYSVNARQPAVHCIFWSGTTGDTSESMSKAKKRTKKIRHDPYGRGDSSLMDIEDEVELNTLAEQESKEEKKSNKIVISEESVKNMLENEGDAGDDEEQEESKKGKVQQRHKLEYRELKAKISALEKQKSRKNSKNEKKEKKEITKQIKQMLGDLKEKHEKELKEFDEQQKSGRTKAQEERLSKFTFNPEMFNKISDPIHLSNIVKSNYDASPPVINFKS
ncbi:hypothetical protein PROFUN_14582 [Planoprotostelium fungivorum]|uniref:IPT/TIG domain-containing protein n=1 Tax=Planoprotostelium fungivorum TaxID=1890364 RepID=A0A2P6MZL8_9EUKA|nr:hypothetical protein PROFUN_14582 [Planoprotostelium fungivorum]